MYIARIEWGVRAGRDAPCSAITRPALPFYATPSADGAIHRQRHNERGIALLPNQALRLKLGTLLAADATTLAPAANANNVGLIAAPFTPIETLTLASLTLASFTGSTPIAGVVGAQETGVDPITGDQQITITPPAGGWRWTVGGSTGLPQTIYGVVLMDHGNSILLGVYAFTTPITLTAAGQTIDLGKIVMTFVNQPIS
jgi:hypothetical protein